MSKINIIVKKIEVSTTTKGEIKILITSPQSQMHLITPIAKLTSNPTNDTKEQLFMATIGKYEPKRSMEANKYMWILCDKIAKSIRSTKEEVYKSAIKQVGVWNIILVQDIAIDSFTERWEAKGLGWFSEKQDGSKVDKCTKLVVYSGSSIYNSSEMARLIDYIVYEAKEHEIETMTPIELEEMLKMIKE